MLSLSLHNPREGISILIDIQSGLVRAALVLFKKNDKPHILYLVTKPILYKSKVDSQHLIILMCKTLEEVAILITEEGIPRAKELGYDHKKIDTIHYVLSSPWVISQSKTIKMHYDVSTEISEAIVLDVVDKERKNFIDKFKEGDFDKEYEFDLVFVEQKIFEVRLNGYPVEDYKKKKIRDLEISFAVTASSKRILENIHTSVTKAIHVKNEAHHSALLLQYSSLRSIITTGDEYISVHVHGELTDIVVVKRGISSYLASFPFGTFTLVRKMSDLLKNNMETNDSLLSMYAEGKLEPKEEQEVGEVIKSVVESWLEEFLNSLNSMGNRTLLPKVIYLSSHSYYSIFKKAFADTQFEVLDFDVALVDKIVSFEKSSEESMLMGMYALALNIMI